MPADFSARLKSHAKRANPEASFATFQTKVADDSDE
jgi:hypothetical protein